MMKQKFFTKFIKHFLKKEIFNIYIYLYSYQVIILFVSLNEISWGGGQNPNPTENLGVGALPPLSKLQHASKACNL